MTQTPPVSAARAAVLSDLEARLLEESLRARLFGAASAELRLGRYRLLDRIGRGGMAIVFAAHDEELDRRVAIKLLLPSRSPHAHDPSARLRREAKALARLSHPHVVQVFEVGEAQGHSFVAMELVAGVTARAWLDERPRRVNEVVDVFLQAGRGLAAAHAAGLVHRDFKPENLLVGADGRVRVADFGLVGEQAASAPASSTALAEVLTHTGAVLGTPAYMAPEQRHGTSPVDARSDQFAFCVALHEALYTRRPVADAQGLPTTGAAGDRVPGRVRRAIERGLASDSRSRWPSMDALLTALDGRRARWRAVRLVALTGIATALLGAATLHVVEADRVAHQQRAAERRLAEIQPSIEERLDAGDVPGAEARLGSLEAEPEVRDTSVPAHAWAWYAHALDQRSLPSDEAWAGAFVRSREPGPRQDALTGLLRAYGARRMWHGVSAALALLAQEFPDGLQAPDVIELRFHAAGARRDLSQALAISRQAQAPARVAALEPVLTAWSAMRPTAHQAVRGVKNLGSALVLDIDGPRPHSMLVRADESLSGPRSEPRSRLFVAHGGDVARLIEDDAEQHALLAWTSTGLHELQRFPADGSRVTDVVAADLDQDGRDEVYVAEQAGARVWTTDAAGTWQRSEAHAATNATHSNGDGVTAADLDGDGRSELVLAMGPWSAYDLRVFAGTDAGERRLIARAKLGHTGGVRVLASPSGPLIVALATQAYPNSTVFPPAHPRGAPQGLYLLRLAGEELVLEQSIAAPDTAEADLLPRCFFVGDVDGDGLEDLVVRLDQPRAGPVPASVVTWVLRQQADGTFEQAILRGMHPLGLAQLDGDSAAELLFVPDGEDRLWIAGAGSSVVAPLEIPDRALADAHARGLEAAGAPADAVALARVGAFETAVAVTRQLARGAGAERGARLRLAAARIADDLERPSQVVELLSELPVDPRLRAEAWERLTRSHLALGRLREAAATLDAWLAEPELDPRSRARAGELREPLKTLVFARHLVSLRTTGPDAPARIDPTAVRRAEGGGLVVDAFARGEPVLAWDLGASDGPLGVEAALSPTALEWSAGVELGLRTREGTRIGAGLRVHGGDTEHQLLLICGPNETSLGLPVGPDGSAGALVLRLVVDPVHGEQECSVSAASGFHRISHSFTGAVEGPLRLELGPASDFGEPGARFRAGLQRLEVMGVAVHARQPDAAAAALVELDGAAALDLLPPSTDPDAQVRRALALVQLGRLDEAAAQLRAVATRPNARVVLGRLLAVRPDRFAPVIRQALGDADYFALVAETRALALGKRRFTAEESTSLVTDLAGIEDTCPHAPCSDVLFARGRAHAQRRDGERARADFVRALEAATPAQRSSIHIELAALAAEDGDLPRVLHHCSQAMRGGAPTEIVRDILRARPEFAGEAVASALAERLGPDDRIGLRETTARGIPQDAP